MPNFKAERDADAGMNIFPDSGGGWIAQISTEFIRAILTF
jgi:hypothetical protein